MAKTVAWRSTFLWVMGLLLLLGFTPHAKSSSLAEKAEIELSPFIFVSSDLPRLEPILLSDNLEFFGNLLERLDLIEVAAMPTRFMADAREEVTLASSGDVLLDETIANTDLARSEINLAINSEAPEGCRVASRTEVNYGAMAEAECTCELYQRNPASRFTKASAKEFHWVKSCKKSRYKPS